MTATVSDLVQAALLLPREARTELVEAILERSEPSDVFIANHMETVRRRMEDVRSGQSSFVAAEEAHRIVRNAIATEI